MSVKVFQRELKRRTLARIGGRGQSNASIYSTCDTLVEVSLIFENESWMRTDQAVIIRNDNVQVGSFLDFNRGLFTVMEVAKKDRNMDGLIRPCPFDVASAFRESSGSEELRDLQIGCKMLQVTTYESTIRLRFYASSRLQILSIPDSGR